MKTYQLYLKDRPSFILVTLDEEPNPLQLFTIDKNLITLKANGSKLVIKASEFVALIPERDHKNSPVRQL